MSQSDFRVKLNLSLPSPIQSINASLILQNQNIQVFCKRDDLIHPVISGNKWRKLSPLIAHLKQNKIKHILSFGGGFSNHLHALGYICHVLSLKHTAIVRGDYSQSLTPMLQDLQSWGTHCQFVNKIEYKKRSSKAYLTHLSRQFLPDIIVPEGGSSADCLLGVSDLVNEYTHQVENISHVVAPVASGGTLAGLINRHTELNAPPITGRLGNAKKPTEIIGIGVLKGKGYLEDLVNGLLPNSCLQSGSIFDNSQDSSLSPKWSIEHDFHHGGYAKNSPQLAQFIHKFQDATNIPIETVYSAKCFYALTTLIGRKRFADNSKIVIIHTGGLQGNRAISQTGS